MALVLAPWKTDDLYFRILLFFYQDCLPVAWDTNEDLIEQQEKYDQILRDHYIQQPTAAENSPADNRTPFIPSPSEDRKINDQDKNDDEEENYDERAPFIPLTIDSELDGDDPLLVEIPFIDSPMTPSPSSWLLNADESMPSPGGVVTSMPAPTKVPPPYKKVTSLSASSSPVLARKEVPIAVKRNGYITNELHVASKGKGFFPNISSWDAEVNAPVQQCGLLQGEELLRALDFGDFL